MTRRRPRGIWLLLLMPMAASSHTLSESHSNWRIDGRIVHLTFTVPDAEARRLAAPGEPMPGENAIGTYLERHVQ
ncbi:MAG: hypothetical protein WB440_19140, partial [Steroidobacteraceae bacterium]